MPQMCTNLCRLNRKYLSKSKVVSDIKADKKKHQISKFCGQKRMTLVMFWSIDYFCFSLLHDQNSRGNDDFISEEMNIFNGTYSYDKNHSSE